MGQNVQVERVDQDFAAQPVVRDCRQVAQAGVKAPSFLLVVGFERDTLRSD
jgi:hypothetical protein